MGILNNIIPMMLTAMMSMNMSGGGNSTGADGSQPAKVITAATVQYNASETDRIAADDITIDGVEGKFPFHQADLAKVFTIRRIATKGYALYYGDDIWYGSFSRNDSPDDTVNFMRINPTSKGINIFGYRIDDSSEIDELEKIYGTHKVVTGKPEFGGDISYIKTSRGNIECTIVFDDQNKVEFISISKKMPFELNNSIVIYGREYSLPSELKAFGKDLIINNEAKAVSSIAFKDESNKIGALLLDKNKVVRIDLDFCEAGNMPPVFISHMELSRSLKYDDFIRQIEGMEYKTMELYDFTAVQIENGDVKLYLSFDKNGLSFVSFYIYSEEKN